MTQPGNNLINHFDRWKSDNLILILILKYEDEIISRGRLRKKKLYIISI